MNNRLAWLLIVISSRSAFAADPEIGDWVIVKESAIAKDGERIVDIKSIPFVSSVEAVDGDKLWLGRAWVRKNDVLSTEEALLVCNDLVRNEPANASNWQCRASVLEVLGQHKRAAKDYTEAIKLGPHDAISYCNRGGARKTMGQFEEAVQDLTEAIRLDPSYAPAFWNRALALMWQKKYDDAMQDSSEAIRLDPRDATAFIVRGVVRQRKGDFEDAISDFNIANEVDPIGKPACFQRARAWQQMGEYEKAVTDFIATTKINPKDAYSYHLAAWIRAACPDERFRNGKQAVDLATKACEITGWKQRQYLDGLAVAYAEAGDFENAIKWQEKSLKLESNNRNKGRLELFHANKPYHGLSED